MIGVTLAFDDEGPEAKWFPPDTIPWNELAFQSSTDALKEFLGRS